MKTFLRNLLAGLAANPENKRKGDNLPLAAYKELIGMLKHEEGLFWNRIQIFLIINAAMLTILGLVSPQKVGQSSLTLKIISVAICVSGVAFALLWYVIVCRSEAFYNHWYEQIKHLENVYLSPINCFNLADEYFEKGEVKIGNKSYKLTFFERCSRIYSVMRKVTLCVSIIWLILGLYFVFSTSKPPEEQPKIILKIETCFLNMNHPGYNWQIHCLNQGNVRRIISDI